MPQNNTVLYALSAPDDFHEEISELVKAKEEIDAALINYRSLLTRLDSMVVTRLAKTEKDSRLRAIRWLYWTCPEVSVSALTAALFDLPLDPSRKSSGKVVGLQGRLRKCVGPAGYTTCYKCGEKAAVTSRSQLESLRKGRSSQCTRCAHNRFTSNEEWERERECREEEYRTKVAREENELQKLTASLALSPDDMERFCVLASNRLWRRMNGEA